MRLFAGYEMNCGIFVSRVEKGSKAAEVGLKRGDQILEVNSSNFEHAMTLAKATTLLLETTHLAITVKSNLLGEPKHLKSKESRLPLKTTYRTPTYFRPLCSLSMYNLNM